MNAKLLREAGEITKGTEVEIASRAGTNDSRSDDDEGGGALPSRRSTR